MVHYCAHSFNVEEYVLAKTVSDSGTRAGQNRTVVLLIQTLAAFKDNVTLNTTYLDPIMTNMVS